MSALFSGRFMGANIHLNLVKPEMNDGTLNVMVAGVSVLNDGKTHRLDNGTIQMDSVTATALARRGVSVDMVNVSDSYVVVHVSLPFRIKKRVYLQLELIDQILL